MAGLDAAELNSHLASNHEERQQLANRASAVITRKISELWTERQLAVRFNLDAQYFDTLISDPNSVYPVDINLNEGSRGFKWFFSFYITFAADTAGGSAENAILLLDEPGLHLHALAQRNLLDLFMNDFKNQSVYTTHSPFMIPTEELSSIRTVNISPKQGTTVTNDPTGDNLTPFPLQAALGYDITQTLFVGANNLVVEGVSDFWYLSSVSEYLADWPGTGSRPSSSSPPRAGRRGSPRSVLHVPYPLSFSRVTVQSLPSPASPKIGPTPSQPRPRGAHDEMGVAPGAVHLSFSVAPPGGLHDPVQRGKTPSQVTCCSAVTRVGTGLECVRRRYAV